MLAVSDRGVAGNEDCRKGFSVLVLDATVRALASVSTATCS